MINKLLSILLLVFLFTACSETAGGIDEGSGGSTGVTGTSGGTFGTRFVETAWWYDDSRVRTIEVIIDPRILTNVVLAGYEDAPDEKAYGYASSFSIDGESVSDIGIRSRGNTSENNYKRQFKISFDCTDPYTAPSDGFVRSQPQYDSRRVHGTKKINLRASQNDPSIIRDLTTAYVMRQAGAKAPRMGFARLYINGEYWGLYLLTEQIDKTFLDSHFNEKSGNLYKGGSGAEFQSGCEGAFELKTNRDLGDTSDLNDFFTSLAGASAATVGNFIDIDTTLGYLAAATLCGHWDSYVWNSNNDYLYHHSDGKFRIIGWDFDNTFGSGKGWSFDALNDGIYHDHNGSHSTCFSKIFSGSSLKARYHYLLSGLISGSCSTTALHEKIDNWKSVIQTAVMDDPRKHVDWRYASISEGNTAWSQSFTALPNNWVRSGFSDNTSGLKGWITERWAIVRGLLP